MQPAERGNHSEILTWLRRFSALSRKSEGGSRPSPTGVGRQGTGAKKEEADSFLFSSFLRIGVFLAGTAQQIVYADIVEIRQDMQC